MKKKSPVGKEGKLSLFADNMMLYTETLMTGQKIIRIYMHSTKLQSKTNIQKSVAILYTNNQL